MRAVPYTGAAVFIICGIVRESISEVEWMTLKEAEELAGIFSKYLRVTTVISNEEMYQIAGTRA